MFLELAKKKTRLLVSFTHLGAWKDSVGQFEKWKQALVLLLFPVSRGHCGADVCVVLTLVSDTGRSASC